MLWDRRSKRVDEFKRECGDFSISRGVHMWQCGEQPNYRPTDEDADKATTEFKVWLGYMAARAIDAMERRDAAHKLEKFDVEIRCRD